jgi:hypothetical protein
MLSELLQDRAALYVSGAMPAPERENFELVLDFHDELRAHGGRPDPGVAERRAACVPEGPPPRHARDAARTG